jgi:hypothetical protein
LEDYVDDDDGGDSPPS